MFTVIVVDDEPAALNHICTIIEKKCPEFQVIERAENGKEAMDKVRQNKPDVVIITAISTYTLRYYEKKGLIHVNRDSAGRRDYCESDVEWVKFIQRLKETGMLLRDIRHYSELRYEGDATMGERMELLVLHRKSVVEEKKRWDEYLKNLDGKIAFYRDNIQ